MSALGPAAIPHPVDGVLFLTAAMAVAGLAQVLWLRARWSWRFAIPLDHGLCWRGRRLLGDNKTLRGFVLMVPASAFCFALAAAALEGRMQLWEMSATGYAWLGALAGLGFMAGELPNSFLKRQLGIAPGRLPASDRARRLVRTGDRLDSLLGMLLVMSLAVPIPWTLWVLAIGIGVGVHGFFSHLLVRWGAKGSRQRADQPRPLHLSLEDVCPEALAGAKASRLAALRQAGFEVPEGVVLSCHALEQFLNAGSLRADIAAATADLDDHDPAALQTATSRVAQLIAEAPFPASLGRTLERILDDIGTPVAVRSSALGEDSAGGSFAGQLDSVLDVEGRAAVEAAVRRCWASRWSERALSYERSRGQPLAGVAVIVQKFVPGAVSGVLFTRDPADSSRMLAELCAGTGETLVGGRVSPARLALTPTGGDTEWLDPGDDPGVCEALEQAGSTARLAAIGRDIEELFGAPQDIEWTVDGDGKIVVLQSRPITALADEIHWSSANIAENYPDPVTPFVASLARRSYRAYFKTLGTALGINRQRIESIRPQLGRVVGLHGGRLYYNLNSVEEILAAAPCGALLSRYFGAFLGTPSAPLIQRAAGPVRTGWELARMLAVGGWHFATLRRRVRLFEQTADEFAARSHPDRLTGANWTELRDLYDGFLDIRLRHWQGAGLADTAAMLTNGALRQLLKRWFPAGHVSLHGSLLKGLTGLASGEPVLELWQLSRRARLDPEIVDLLRQPDRAAAWEKLRANFPDFAAAVDSYLEAWGYRCSGELMLTVASFQEQPGELLAVLEGYLDLEEPGPAEIVRRQAAERLELTDSTCRRLRRQRLLARLPAVSPAPVFSRLLRATQKSVALRERARLKQALLYSRCRRILLEVGERLVDREGLASADDILWLRSEEVEELLGGGLLFREQLPLLIAARREAHTREIAWRPPEDLRTTVDGAVAARTAVTPLESTNGLEGVGACGGRARGRAALLENMSQFSKLRAGDILVAPQTDPGWGPVFFMIGGLVLERGGTLSHGAIIAREFGIPAVVGVRGAFDRIEPGSEIAVDGDTGRVAVVG